MSAVAPAIGRRNVPLIVCLDLEGVLVPEVWIAFAEKTGIPELRRTTRDEPDYDKLMRGRLEILDRHGLKLPDIQEVIATLRPLDGALDFLETLRARTQVIILSDTFYQFAEPLMRQLHWPTLFCHELVVEPSGRVADYRLRIPDGKRKAVAALKALEFTVHAAGDSYNDTSMLAEADRGVLFRCPDNVAAEFPQFRRTETYAELMSALME
jgi:phosphoserine/homoserine phosphotransferase